MGLYRHVWTDHAAGWRQHGIEVEDYGMLFVTVPCRLGSEEDQFTETFLTRAQGDLAGTTGALVCHYTAVAAGRDQRQQFVCDHNGRPLLRTLYVPAGTERDRRIEEFLREAVARVGPG